jgi:hypothetical protein
VQNAQRFGTELAARDARREPQRPQTGFDAA